MSSPTTLTLLRSIEDVTLTVNGDLGTTQLPYVTSIMCGPTSVGMSWPLCISILSLRRMLTFFLLGVVMITLTGPSALPTPLVITEMSLFSPSLIAGERHEGQ